MKFRKMFSNNKGVIFTDIAVGILIIILFTGILTRGFYRIYKRNAEIELNAYAVYYSVKIMEDIDKMSYEEVTNEMDLGKYGLSDNFKASIMIENYNENDNENIEDIIKVVNLKIEYDVPGGKDFYKIRKLKIKENLY